MELYPHQEKLLETLAENDFFAIFWQCRVMKTMPVALHMTNLIMQGKAEDGLVIAPKSALGAWKRDFLKFRGKRKEASKKIKLVNYELVWRRKVYDKPFDIVVLDESHRTARRTSKQSKFCLKYNKRSKYRYILTGTPIGQGRLHDLWAQMEFLMPGFLGKYKNFEDYYCITRQLPNTFVRIVTGYRHKEELLKKIAPHVSFLKLIDIADMPDDLPDNLVVCPASNPSVQKGVQNDYVAKYDILIPNPVVKLAKLRQVASGFIIDEQGVTHVISDHKQKTFGELLDEIGNEKIVIFCEFKNSIRCASVELAKREISHLTLDGRQKDKEIWKMFQEQDHIKAIVCQYQTANAGIDLWKARNLVFYEPSLSTLMTEQSRERIKKAIDPQPCAYHWLLTKNSVELKIYKQLRKHKDFTLDCLEEWSWAKKDKDEDFIF